MEGEVIETLGPERQISLANVKELNFLQVSQTSDLVKVLTSWRYFKYKKGYNAYATSYWLYSNRMNIETSQAIKETTNFAHKKMFFFL